MKQKITNFQLKFSKLTNSDLIEKSNSTEIKTSSKKNKRRTKALKAKIAKIKMADLTERYRMRAIMQEKKESIIGSASEGSVAAPSDSEESICVNAIKTAIGILEDEQIPDNLPHDKVECKLIKQDWKAMIQQLPFHNCPNLKIYKPAMQDYLKKCNPKCKYIDVDLAIKYLEGLLAMIVNKYKMVWEMDKTFEQDFIGNDIDINALESKIENEQNLEKDKLRLVHREFYNLTRNIRQLYDHDPDRSHFLLKELEKLLLTHNIRGDTIMEQVTAMEVLKINVTMPVDFEQHLSKYMERVVNKDMDELNDVHIQIIEHISAQKSMDHNSMGDYLYMSEINTKHCDCTTGINHNFEYYLASSILNICDDGEETTTICCNKGCISSPSEPDESKDSRWCSILRSLEMMEDAQTFFNGKIRISNIEKRKSHILSPSGNFAALEIGLGQDNQPLAIKFVPKNDTYAVLLKNLIDPILELRHKNILHYYMCAYDCNFLIIATPLCEYNLGQYVLKIKHTQMKICKVNIIRQILTGLMYLHDHDEPIIHGNLKPSNVLIDVFGNVRIAEFGIHKALVKVKNLPESSVIWFATECYKQYKQNNPMECTCASDIQVAGMLAHFAVNNGSHPFGKDVLDILKNLEKASPQILCKNMELYDLLTWMLLGEPSERPTIHQVLSHIFFWSNKKKWRYIIACAGLNPKTNIPMDVQKLHASLDKTAYKENITGNCWMLTAKKKYPQAAFIDNNDTPSGLLKFIKFVVENNLILQDDTEKSLSCFILNAFPYFALSLYRMIENTEWSDHRVFMPFHNVVDY